MSWGLSEVCNAQFTPYADRHAPLGRRARHCMAACGREEEDNGGDTPPAPPPPLPAPGAVEAAAARAAAPLADAAAAVAAASSSFASAIMMMSDPASALPPPLALPCRWVDAKGADALPLALLPCAELHGVGGGGGGLKDDGA